MSPSIGQAFGSWADVLLHQITTTIFRKINHDQFHEGECLGLSEDLDMPLTVNTISSLISGCILDDKEHQLYPRTLD